MEGPDSNDYVVYKLDAEISNRALRKYTCLRQEAMQTIFDHDLVFSPMILGEPSSRRNELAMPGYHCWICVAPNALNGLVDMDHGQWVGNVTINGPDFQETHGSIETPASSDPEDLHKVIWRPRGLYFKPAFRCGPAFVALTDAVSHWLEHQARVICGMQSLDSILERQLTTSKIDVDFVSRHTGDDRTQVLCLTKKEMIIESGWETLVAWDMLGPLDLTDQTWVLFQKLRKYCWKRPGGVLRCS